MKFDSGTARLAALLLLGAASAHGDADVRLLRKAPGPAETSGFGKSRATSPTWLGVAIGEAPIEVTAKLPVEPGTGLVVDQVIVDSPAAIAGIQRGDLLAKLNDQTLVTPRQLQMLVMRRRAGEQVELTFFRKGEKRRVVVILLPRERI